MPATNIYDLLPIPEEVKNPHPYQVFGIEDGEQDLAVISEKIREVVGNLKQVKDSTDPKLWTKAAKLAQQARLTLANPKTKAKLDARFGIIAEDSVEQVSADPLASILPASDPLAGLLPTADPLGGSDPLAAILPSEPAPSEPIAATADSSQATSMPAGIFGTPEQATLENPESASGQNSTEDIQILVPDARPGAPTVTRNPHRRQQSILGVMMFGTFSLGMVTIIGILIWFMVFRGEVAITQTDGSLTISTTGKDAKKKDAVNTGKTTRKKATPEPLDPDPVMGTLEPNKKKSKKDNGMTDLEKKINDDKPMNNTGSEADPEPGKPMVDPKPEKPEVPKKPAITDEMIAEAEKQLANVSMLIKSTQWDKMKSAAESASELPMSDEQKERAEALYEVADLASYYRVGIEKSVAAIPAGNDFEIATDIRVIVVEKGDDFIAIRLNAKTRNYKFDALPLSLAHKLASFKIPESPTQAAAKAVYQIVVTPEEKKESREEAFQWLDELGEVDGVDPKRLSKTLQEIFK